MHCTINIYYTQISFSAMLSMHLNKIVWVPILWRCIQLRLSNCIHKNFHIRNFVWWPHILAPTSYARLYIIMFIYIVYHWLSESWLSVLNFKSLVATMKWVVPTVRTMKRTKLIMTGTIYILHIYFRELWNWTIDGSRYKHKLERKWAWRRRKQLRLCN